MVDINTYKTVREEGTSFLKESNSKFYGFAVGATSEEEVQYFLRNLQSMHSGASHYCYAWRIDPNGAHYRVNDDGEPGNSAGQPIYRQILSRDLTCVLAVVVRFYGGKKLGIPGLIHAYGLSASLALDEAGIQLVEVTIDISVRETAKQDYLIFEFARRYNLEIILQPSFPGESFTLRCKQRDSVQIVEVLKDLPNFDWKYVEPID